MKKNIALFLFLVTLTTIALANWQHSVYAGYFYYFAKHTKYEQIKDNSEFKIAVIGSKEMFQATRHMALSKNIDGKVIRVSDNSDIKHAEGAHILYLDASRIKDLSYAISFCEKNNILLVTNILGASHKGADIELWEDTDHNIRFSINDGACTKGHLELSSVLHNMSKSH